MGDLQSDPLIIKLQVPLDMRLLGKWQKNKESQHNFKGRHERDWGAALIVLLASISILTPFFVLLHALLISMCSFSLLQCTFFVYYLFLCHWDCTYWLNMRLNSLTDFYNIRMLLYASVQCFFTFLCFHIQEVGNSKCFTFCGSSILQYWLLR